MSKLFLFLLIVALLFAAPACGTRAPSPAASSLPAAFKTVAVAQLPVSSLMIESIPDLTQTDPEAQFPHGGGHFCGPVAVSNSIFWLAGQGYGSLLPGDQGRRASQAQLAIVLGSGKYMDTTLEDGTPPAAVLAGLSRYVRDCGYRYRRLEYQGWRRHPREFSTGVSVPDLDWVKQGLIGDSAVLLNIGWYRTDAERNRYRRLSGHWVTLVGFGVDEAGRLDPNILVINDPAPRTGMAFAHEFVRMERLSGGTMEGVGVVQSAAGFYRMGGGMHIKRGADCAILDGAVILEMQNAKSEAG